MQINLFIQKYYKKHLELPPLRLLSKNFKEMSTMDIRHILNKHFDRYYFGNKQQLQKKYPLPIHISPFYASMDLGFLSTTRKNKKHIVGKFLIVQHLFTNQIALRKIRSKKLDELKNTLSNILDQKEFASVRLLLSDEESSFKSLHMKKFFRDKYHVKIVTSAQYKRPKVEKSILVVKNLCRREAMANNISLYDMFRKKNSLQEIAKIFNAKYQQKMSFPNQLKQFYTLSPKSFLIQPTHFPYTFELGDQIRFFKSPLHKKKADYKFTRDGPLEQENVYFKDEFLTLKRAMYFKYVKRRGGTKNAPPRLTQKWCQIISIACMSMPIKFFVMILIFGGL